MAADKNNYSLRLQLLTPDGTHLKTIGGGGSGPEQTKYPRGVARGRMREHIKGGFWSKSSIKERYPAFLLVPGEVCDGNWLVADNENYYSHYLTLTILPDHTQLN